jgi:hypothetical protein
MCKTEIPPLSGKASTRRKPAFCAAAESWPGVKNFSTEF